MSTGINNRKEEWYRLTEPFNNPDLDDCLKNSDFKQKEVDGLKDRYVKKFKDHTLLIETLRYDTQVFIINKNFLGINTYKKLVASHNFNFEDGPWIDYTIKQIKRGRKISQLKEEIKDAKERLQLEKAKRDYYEI